ncbi:MAG: V-type ATP synthase subunit E family protein [Candidatus Methanomethylicia archaeon]
MFKNTSENRVKKIYDYIQEELNKQYSKIMLDAEEKAQEIISEATANAKSLYLEKIDEIKNEFNKIKNKSIAEAEFNAKQKILKQKNELIHSIFDCALSKLKQYITTDVYVKFLEKSLMEIALNTRSGKIEILLCDSDTIISENIIKALEEKINHKLNTDVSFIISQEKIRAAGGFIARCADGKISYNYTFEAILDRIKEPLRPVVSKILFE